MRKNNITANESSLIESIKEIIITSRKNIVRSVNTEMLSAYWNIGRLIVEDEQKNQERAQYGEQMSYPTVLNTFRPKFLRKLRTK